MHAKPYGDGPMWGSREVRTMVIIEKYWYINNNLQKLIGDLTTRQQM